MKYSFKKIADTFRATSQKENLFLAIIQTPNRYVFVKGTEKSFARHVGYVTWETTICMQPEFKQAFLRGFGV